MDKLSLEIQPLTINDINEIASIEKGFAELQWSDDSFCDEISNKKSICLKAVCDKEIIGYIIARLLFDECHIINLFVKSSFRLQRVATELINHLFNMLSTMGTKRVFLELRISNTGAVKLYEKFGFKKVAIRKDLYMRPLEDGFFMVKNLQIKNNIDA